MSPESSGSVAAGRSVKGKEKAGSSEPRAAGAMNVVAALDFSLVLSSSKQCWMRFNGPGRFLNVSGRCAWVGYRPPVSDGP